MYGDAARKVGIDEIDEHDTFERLDVQGIPEVRALI